MTSSPVVSSGGGVPVEGGRVHGGEVGDWCIPDKRGEGSAHKIGVVIFTEAALDQRDNRGGPLAGFNYDYRRWTSVCGSVIESAFLFSVLIGPEPTREAVYCAACAIGPSTGPDRSVFGPRGEGAKRMSDKITAPFTVEQVEQLNRYQRSSLMHPFTCGNQNHRRHWDLVATEAGWVCPSKRCDYTQVWAHAWMADKDTLDSWQAERDRLLASVRAEGTES